METIDSSSRTKDHFGVVKAFLDADMLPRVISGTSAGGLVAALVCTRTDSELKKLLVPELAERITACEEPFRVWFKRFWTTGARFDSIAWARKCSFFTRGSMTFKEAYIRTGRILNISVVPADRHSPTKLLNYMTAPDTVIWSALLASAAVPGILNPVVLMQKLKDGALIPWNWGSKFKDGSLRVDIPVQSLNLYFNVTHPIVSQVNPHVHLFFFAPRGSAGKPVAHRKGKGWRGNFLLSAAEQWLKLELTKNFKLIRDLDLLPQLLGQDWSSVFLQRFDGTVTIWPRTRFMDWLRILSDPDEIELARMMVVGQLVAWPKLHIIENRFRLEKQIFLGRQEVRKASQAQTRAQERADVQPEGTIPPPVTGTKLHIPLPVPPTLSAQPSEPMPVDSDVETAYVQGHPIPRRQSSPIIPVAGSSRRSSNAQEYPNRRPGVIRRRWATSHQEPEDNDDDPLVEADYGRATPDPPPPDDTEPEPTHQPIHSDHHSRPASPSLFRRLRTASTTFGPFASLRAKSRNHSGAALDGTSRPESVNGAAWSGDSSSDDDDLSLASKRLPTRSNSLMEDWGERDGDGYLSDEERKWLD